MESVKRMHFRRIVIVDADSLGIGAARDAKRYGTEKADTLGHLDQQYLLDIPTLQRLGIGNIKRRDPFLTVPPARHPLGFYGKLKNRALSETKNACLREMFDFNEPLRTLSIFNHLSYCHYDTIIISRFIDYLANQDVCKQIQCASDNTGFRKLLIQFNRLDTGLVYLRTPELPAKASAKNPQEYAAFLSIIDKQVDLLMSSLTSTDLLIFTSSFANDPTDKKHQVTREYLPVILYTPGMTHTKSLGVQNAGAIAATLLDNFKAPGTQMPDQCSLFKQM